MDYVSENVASPASPASGSNSSPSHRSWSGSPGGSRASSPGSGAGSPKSAVGSPDRAGSVSPAQSGASASPARSMSPRSREHSSSPSPQRSHSGSPNREGSVTSSRDRSRSQSVERDGSASPSRYGNHGSPHSNKSESSAHSRDGSVSPTASKGSHKSSHDGSRSASPDGGVPRSRSKSPQRSNSQSPGRESRSRSGSPEERSRSRSGSPKERSRSASRSPGGDNRSRSASRSEGSGSHRSRSGSPSVGGSAQKDSDLEGSVNRNKTEDSEGDGLSDIEGEEKVKATVDELFGDAGDISSDEEGHKNKVNEEKGEADDDVKDGEKKVQKPVIEGSDEENQEVEVPETRIAVEIPRIKTELGKAVHYVKLPNFLSVETRPFDSATYEDEIDEDEVLDEEGRTRLKLKVENTIRWRSVKDEEGNDRTNELGEMISESNGRVVKWKDGSMSLHLGDEIFDIHTMPIQGDFNHLFVRQGTGLQGQNIFKTKLSFRPHSTESFTHRKMTLSLADRSTKKQKVKILPISGHDPESQRTEMIKKEDERLRASMKRESQKRRVRERTHTKGLSSGYIEGYDDEEEEEGISLAAIKNKYKPGTKKERLNIYSSDSEDGYDSEKEETGAKRLMKAKNVISDEDSETETAPKKKRARVVESDDEEQPEKEEATTGAHEEMDTEGGAGGSGSESD